MYSPYIHPPMKAKRVMSRSSLVCRVLERPPYPQIRIERSLVMMSIAGAIVVCLISKEGYVYQWMMVVNINADDDHSAMRNVLDYPKRRNLISSMRSVSVPSLKMWFSIRQLESLIMMIQH